MIRLRIEFLKIFVFEFVWDRNTTNIQETVDESHDEDVDTDTRDTSQ